MWNGIWKMAPLRLNFIIRAAYNLLSKGANFHNRGASQDPKFPFCNEKHSLGAGVKVTAAEAARRSAATTADNLCKLGIRGHPRTRAFKSLSEQKKLFMVGSSMCNK